VRFAIVALLATSCTDERLIEVKLAHLETGFGPIIDAPASAAAGVPITVTVMTTGGGCTGFDHTDVESTELGADIYPYNHTVHPREHEKCTQILRPTPHEVTLTFQTPGDKIIRTYGLEHTLTDEWVIEETAAIHVE
jgi:hypothetical protein